ncbi:MAG: U32 family peptidase [Rikenellaceae bacterium]
MIKKIELLAPVRGFEAACAAVDFGADALYMGAAGFGARSAATNSVEDVARAVEYAHQYGVRLYATLNTLLFEQELDRAEAQARELVSVGVDGLIVQDMAYARMGLGVDLHCSTQMCNMTAEGVQFLSECGFSRVVLERNLTKAQMAKIAKAVPNVELEAFVHGAICVGYSGRCLLSRSMSSRSGNRGECSQPCRLSYDLVNRDGEKIIEAKHLLSVKDLNLSQRLGELLDLGVTSFKIEGRLKEIGYTKNIVAHYRQQLDRAVAEREGFTRSSVGRSRFDFTPNPQKSFSRGETAYLFDGVGAGSAVGVASFESPKSKGEVLGRCVAVDKRGNFAIEFGGELSTGDGLCFVKGGELVGGSVNRVQRDGESVWVTLSRGARVEVGTMIYRNIDRQFELQLERSPARRVVMVEGSVVSSASRVEVRYRDRGRGLMGVAALEGEFESAQNSAKMAEVIRQQLSKCGDTIFEAASIDLSGWGGEFIASSMLSQLRREALEQLRLRSIEATEASRGAAFVENKEARYPVRELGADFGITNPVAEQFYRDHGVIHIEPQLEIAEDNEAFKGAKVLQSSYCIRREIGECLKRGSRLRDPLYLVRGKERFKLEFECGRCRMALIKL